jgi:MraZ protein
MILRLDKAPPVLYHRSGFLWSKVEQDLVLRGTAPARIDDKGRLKIPNAFRALVEERHGRDVFVTSLTGESVRIYPMAVWAEIERKLSQIPSTHPSRVRFFNRVNYYGQQAEFDNQGRVLIHPRLRDPAAMTGEVDVFGMYDHIEVWNHDRFVTKLERDPFTDEDARALAEFGI